MKPLIARCSKGGLQSAFQNAEGGLKPALPVGVAGEAHAVAAIDQTDGIRRDRAVLAARGQDAAGSHNDVAKLRQVFELHHEVDDVADLLAIA